MNVAIVGGGRMGLPLACVIAKHGAHVDVCDLNGTVVEAIRSGQSPYDEPGLPELLADMVARGRMGATTETADACARAEVVIVIVPAHLTPERDIDLGILRAASREVGKGLRRGSLVSYETTVSVGATRQHLAPVLEKWSGMQAGRDFHVAFSPERVKANHVLPRLETTPKVVGGLDAKSCRRAVEFYGTYLGAPIDDVETLEAAEFSKLAGMLYRDVNIALANELAEFSESAGIDFRRICEVSNRDGEASLLEPGIGVGGHCTPVYPYFLTRASRRLGVTQRLAEAAREINDAQPKRHVRRLARMWAPLENRRVHILGLGFRPDVKVDTFSPAYALREELEYHRAHVSIEDPCYTDDEIRLAGFEPARVGVNSVEAVILNTAHTAFASADFAEWRASGVEAIVDGRSFWSADAARAAGLLYLGVGKGTPGALEDHPFAAEREAVQWQTS